MPSPATTFKKSALALGLCLSLTALADGQDQGGPGGPGGPGEEGASWGLGIFAMMNQKPYLDIDAQVIAIPAIQFENQYLRVFGPGIEFKLPSLTLTDSQQLNFGLLAQYDFGGYDAKEAKKTPILNGMEKRSGGFWAGAKAEWQNDIANLSVEWTQDITGDSEGARVKVGLERTWMIGQHVMLMPRVVGIWQDENYNNYMYGVRAAEARVGRPEFITEAGINTELGLRAIYMFDMQHSLFLDVSATNLATEIQDSPLVDSSTETGVLFGYVYRF
ncbi:MAG: hypothetical protein RL497_3032 [Pseudomonadota bacterium]|jgi:outer membrane protein